MINGRTLLATLEQQQTGKRRISAPGVVGRVALALLAIAVVGGTLAFIAYRLWLGWQTGQWDGFWMLTLNGIFFLSLPLVVLVPLFNQQPKLTPALPALRLIAAAREDALTPPVVPQPVALAPESLPMSATAIGPLKRMNAANANSSARLFLFAMIFVMLLFVLVFTSTTDFELGPTLPFNFDPFGGFSSAFALPLAMVGFYAIIFGAFLGGVILRARPGWATMTAQADAEGIRWRAGRDGVERRIAWRDARSFSRLRTALTTGAGVYATLNATTGVVYLLDSPDASLMWTLAPTAIDSQYSAAEYLCRMIVSRTGLPLRDLTVTANDLATTRGNVQRLVMMRSVMGSGAAPSPTLLALAQTPPAEPQRLWGQVAPLLTVSLIPLLLCAAIFGYGGYVQNYQQDYFASLPQRLHAEGANFQDPLSANIGNFPVNALTKNYHQGERYANGAYELFGDDGTQFNYAWTPGAGVVGDGAIEVTASEHGTTGISTGEGIGLLFGVAQDGNSFGMFDIHADGTWELDSYRFDQSDPPNSWGYLGGGSSSAIHQGIGASNTLLVLKRGKDYLLYVNGRLIDVFYDEAMYAPISLLPTSGYVGLYLNDDAQTGDFTNLAVYPVQPSSSEWWV